MKELHVPAGSKILLGAPANPLDQIISISIGQVTDSIDDIFEAHLPQMFLPESMEEPAQVLVAVIRDGANVEDVMKQLGEGLAGILPEETHLDVLPIPMGTQLVDDIRRTGCLI